MQITNLEIIQNHLLSGSFNKTDDHTKPKFSTLTVVFNTEDNLKRQPRELCAYFICQMTFKIRPRYK